MTIGQQILGSMNHRYLRAKRTLARPGSACSNEIELIELRDIFGGWFQN